MRQQPFTDERRRQAEANASVESTARRLRSARGAYTPRAVRRNHEPVSRLGSL